ncbi:MAG: T9SS type A sorting domain-containing protein, partial [Nitrososphaerales archaeon]
KTTDSGVNWNFTAFYLNNNEGKATGADFTDANNGYLSAAVWDGTGAVSKTTDGGTNWVTIMNTNPLWDIDFPVSATGLVGYAVGESGTILKTYNGGLSWPPQQSGTQQKLNGVYFLDLDFGFAVGDGGIIIRTTEGGVPVELTSFSAIVNERDIILNWTTATETNNRGFEVEKLFGNDWVVIGFVEGNGTTTELKSYSFTDENIAIGIYKYRLKQIDFDGTYEYSNSVEAQVTAPEEFILSQNYPNPFNPSTKIKFSIPRDISSERQEVTLIVYDVLGDEIVTLVNEEKTPGEYEVELDGTQLPSGIYFYQIKVGSFIQTKKMILIK